jgi:hypothetical protein
MTPSAIILALVACSGSPPPTPTIDTVVDSPTETAVVDTPPDETELPGGLNGTAPEAAIALPDFQARNEHNELRDRSALLGHPTVMWFFPATNTPG